VVGPWRRIVSGAIDEDADPGQAVAREIEVDLDREIWLGAVLGIIRQAEPLRRQLAEGSAPARKPGSAAGPRPARAPLVQPVADEALDPLVVDVDEALDVTLVLADHPVPELEDIELHERLPDLYPCLVARCSGRGPFHVIRGQDLLFMPCAVAGLVASVYPRWESKILEPGQHDLEVGDVLRPQARGVGDLGGGGVFASQCGAMR
jgi:hypothetical protein